MLDHTIDLSLSPGPDSALQDDAKRQKLAEQASELAALRSRVAELTRGHEDLMIHLNSKDQLVREKDQVGHDNPFDYASRLVWPVSCPGLASGRCLIYVSLKSLLCRKPLPYSS